MSSASIWTDDILQSYPMCNLVSHATPKKRSKPMTVELCADSTVTLFDVVGTEHFAARTQRNPARFLLHRPIWTPRSASSKKCRRSSRHAKQRSERKRFVLCLIYRCMVYQYQQNTTVLKVTEFYTVGLLNTIRSILRKSLHVDEISSRSSTYIKTAT